VVPAAALVEAKASAAEARAAEARALAVGAKVEVLASHVVSLVIVLATALRVAEVAKATAVARVAVEARADHSLAVSGRKAIAPLATAAAFRTTDLGPLSKDHQGFGEAAPRA